MYRLSCSYMTEENGACIYYRLSWYMTEENGAVRSTYRYMIVMVIGKEEEKLLNLKLVVDLCYRVHIGL